MNELTYVLAILVHKEVLTPLEARKVQKAAVEAVITSNLTEMVTKVDKALRQPDDGLEKISAKDFLNLYMQL